MRRIQKQEAAEFVLESGKRYFAQSAAGGSGAIPEQKRRLIYEYALTAAENIAQGEDSRNIEGAIPVRLEVNKEAAMADAVRRIALGNAVAEGDVLAIVREGSAGGC